MWLQNEKRQLETAMVVESTLVNKARRGELGSRRSLETGEGGDSEVRTSVLKAGCLLQDVMDLQRGGSLACDSPRRLA